MTSMTEWRLGTYIYLCYIAIDKNIHENVENSFYVSN